MSPAPFPRRALLVAVPLLAACVTAAPKPTTSAETRVVAPALCAHEVPAASCVKCHPELVDAFKRRGDWCPEHDVPETQCLACHPGMTFAELPTLPESADLAFLSTMGEDVPALEPHAVPGKVTVFDFYAPWCVPCREIDVHVYGLLTKRADVAYRKLNVMNWETPLAKRWMSSVATLPYVVVYGRDGRLVRALSGLDLAALDAAIAEGAAR